MILLTFSRGEDFLGKSRHPELSVRQTFSHVLFVLIIRDEKTNEIAGWISKWSAVTPTATSNTYSLALFHKVYEKRWAFFSCY